MPTLTRSSQTITHKVDGQTVYHVEPWYIDGLDLTGGAPEASDVLAIARNLSDDFPDEGEPKFGLAQRSQRVEEMPGYTKRRRLITAWGTRSGGGPLTTTRESRARVVPDDGFVQPYFVITGNVQTQVGPIPLVVRRSRAIGRNSIIYYEGRLVGGQFTQLGIAQVVAANRRKLYVVSDQPALLLDADVHELRTNQLWVWTIFKMGTWVQAQGPGTIEPGSLPVAELPPLGEYAQRLGGGNTLQAIPAGQLYEVGDTLSWRI